MSDTRPEQWSGYRPKVTIRRMMIGVAVVAAFLPAFREDTSGSFLAGALIVGTCVILLAYKMSSNSIALYRSAGRAVSPWRRIWIWLGSLAWALLIILAADFLFLFFYVAVGGLISPHFLWYRIDPIVILLSALSTVIVVVLLRRNIRREWEAKTCPPPPEGLPDRVDPDQWT